jgi:insertion element IS1 protein InsB
VDRATRCIVSHAVCFERTPELMQAVVDAAPKAARYFSDAFNTYKELCWWGAHQARRDKAETYSVEGDNAELRHYLARLTRKSRCFSKCIKALRRAVELFVWCWNKRQLRKQQQPRYPSHLIDSVSCLI